MTPDQIREAISQLEAERLQISPTDGNNPAASLALADIDLSIADLQDQLNDPS